MSVVNEQPSAVNFEKTRLMEAALSTPTTRPKKSGTWVQSPAQPESHSPVTISQGSHLRTLDSVCNTDILSHVMGGTERAGHDNVQQKVALAVRPGSFLFPPFPLPISRPILFPFRRPMGNTNSKYTTPFHEGLRLTYSPAARDDSGDEANYPATIPGV